MANLLPCFKKRWRDGRREFLALFQVNSYNCLKFGNWSPSGGGSARRNLRLGCMTRVHERQSGSTFSRCLSIPHLSTAHLMSPLFFLLHRAQLHASTTRHRAPLSRTVVRLHQPHRQSSRAIRLHRNYSGWPSRRCGVVVACGRTAAALALMERAAAYPPQRDACHNLTICRSRREPPPFPATAGLDGACRCRSPPRRPHATIPRGAATSSATTAAPSCARRHRRWTMLQGGASATIVGAEVLLMKIFVANFGLCFCIERIFLVQLLCGFAR
jgi:hypothetical protein